MKRYTIIDQETGESSEITNNEIVSYPKDTEVAVISSDSVSQFMSGNVPYHIKQLAEKAKRLGLSSEEAEYELDCFVGGPSKDLSEYINNKVTVVGSAIVPHGPYKAFADKDNPDAPLQPGYLRCLFAISELDKDGNYVILECNGVNIFDHTVNMISSYGWYLWENPREYIIKRGGKHNSYYMRSTARPKSKGGGTKVTEDKSIA